VLALAVLGMLAVASPADTALRVPGTTLRFGLADTAISMRGFAAAGPDGRTGRCRFFGLTSDATLTFADGRLARAEFTVGEASPYELAYVRDQLTAMGFRRSCAKSASNMEVCDWTGRTLVHVTVDGAKLTASVVSAHGAVATAARDTVRRTEPGAGAIERAIARLKGTPPPAWITARDTVPSATPTPREVPVLPETLAVSVPGRASPYAPATLLSEPRCEYPEAARAAGIQGRVWVLAFVDTDGRVIRTQLKSGIPVLNAAALGCAKRWSFKPVTRQGVPCRYWVLVPLTFTAH
jgi:TonB family protein